MTQDHQHHIESCLAQGDIARVMAVAEDLHVRAEMNPELALFLLARARSWHTAGYFTEQRRICEIVLTTLPEYFEALHLLGFSAQIQGRHKEAEDYYRRALASKPDYAFAALALAQIRMMRTRFEQGREGYEARWEARTEASGPDWRGLPIARWRGENLKGKHLYLWAEQGLGDIVMFASFLPHLLAGAPGRVALGMFPKLIPLFARSFPAVNVESIDDAAQHALAPTVLASYPQIEKFAQVASVPFSLEPLKASYAYASVHGLFDFAAPMGDMLVHFLPGFFPARHQGAYLAADPERVKQVRTRLATPGQGRRIGVSWHTQNTREVTRNITLAELLPLLRTPGCHFISLQHQVPREEIAQFCAAHDCRITVDEQINISEDAEGLAALIAAMDEVVTIDNSNVHLAGALGVKTTLLLPTGCNFRWPDEGDGTLWYKSVKILRQQVFSEWGPVVARAAAAIRS